MKKSDYHVSFIVFQIPSREQVIYLNLHFNEMDVYHFDFIHCLEI